MAHCMKSFLIKTHRPESRYHQPHFFILNKGLNSGKPLNNASPNCFVCLTECDEHREFLYWLCFGLWKSKSFHYFPKGSVIPFVTIGETRKLIRESSNNASSKSQAFEKATKIPAHFWMDHQKSHDEYKARLKHQEDL